MVNKAMMGTSLNNRILVTLFTLSFFILSGMMVSGCAEREKVQEKYQNHIGEANEALKRVSPEGKIRPALIIDEKPWFGHKAVRMRNGDPLPGAYTEQGSVVITFERALTLPEIARQIQIATGLRVVVNGLSSDQQAQTFLPVDGVQVRGGRVLWQGSLQRLLNQISDNFDTEWSFVNGVIQMTAQVTRTFMLHALAGEIRTSGSVETGSTSEAGNLPSQEVDASVTLAIWDEIQDAISNILAERGNATFSPATGTITVNGTPSAVREVEEYLRYQNRMRLRRVAVTVRVLSVQRLDLNNVNFDLQGVLEQAFADQPLFFSSTGSDGLAAGIVRSFPDGSDGLPNLTTNGAAEDSVSAVIDALAERNKVSIAHTGTVITLSDQPAPLQVARQRTYIARTSAAATSDSSSTSLEPGTVEEGLTMNVLPRVIEKDRVLLRIGIGITQVREIVNFTAGDLTVQLPDLDTTGFLQNIVLSGGETLVLSGFERDNVSRTNRGVGHPDNIFLGGQDETERGRNVTVLLITTDILPEDPFGILRR